MLSQDVVLLQEVFVRADVSLLIAAAAKGKLVHAHFFNGGMLHGELLMLSSHPILAVPFSSLSSLTNSSIHDCHEAEALIVSLPKLQLTDSNIPLLCKTGAAFPACMLPHIYGVMPVGCRPP